jgi:hypothetical protein
VWDGVEKNGEEDRPIGLRANVMKSISSHLPSHHKEGATAEPVRHDTAEAPEIPTPSRPTTAMRVEPRVLHGHTMTKEVPFRDVCMTIRECAFVKTDLPIIVSLEIHTSPEQQEIMVEIMQEAWKGMLVTRIGEPCTKLPSPADLRRKILVKVKHAEVRPDLDRVETKDPLASSRSAVISHSDSDSRTSNSGSTKQTKKGKIIEALSSLGVYTRSYHFKNLSAPEATIPTHVFSLSEKKLTEVHESDGPALFQHNRNFLMRAFPSGTRVSSSNLDPVFFWRNGVQMVALNWQKWDAGMMLNEAMFAGSEGWVLKPAGYLGGELPSTTDIPPNAMPCKRLDLSIEILAAQGIPLPLEGTKAEKFRPYVKCELHTETFKGKSGNPNEGEDESQGDELKRRTKSKRGTDPDFGGELLQFRAISEVVEDLSFIRYVPSCLSHPRDAFPVQARRQMMLREIMYLPDMFLNAKTHPRQDRIARSSG